MRKCLLVIGMWLMSLSLVTASGEPVAAFTSGTSILVINDQDAPVYPNPAVDHIFFRLTDSDLSRDESLVIEVRDILGNKMPIRLERTNSDTYRIGLNNFPSGYYLLVLQCEQCNSKPGHYKEIHKFLKQ